MGSATKRGKRPPPGVWYADGLAFECQRCGRCCTGAPGDVLVTGEDITAMAQRLDLGEEEFARRFLRLRRGRYGLRERPGSYDCVLLDEETRACMVYEERPIQCRAWPWWRENLASPEAWEACQEECPGIGRGRKHSAAYITRQMEQEYAVNQAG